MLTELGEEVVWIIRDNFSRSQNAGEFRVDDEGSLPRSTMQLPSKYTLAKRRARGNDNFQPLVDTGELRDSISIRRRTPTRVIIGPRGSRNRRKMVAQLGTGFTGIKSTDLLRDIPPRNPIGISTDDKVTLDRLASRYLYSGDRSTTRTVYQVRF
jgi:hypothetical protein